VKQYWVYILSSRSRTLYVGVTSNLTQRIYQHRHQLMAGFTKRYNITRLVYFEETNSVHAALKREKELKGWLRSRKIALIESFNPAWRDLGKDILDS
jgi:putative endonuclease